MNAMIGWLPDEAAVSPVIEQLKAAGIDDKNIHILTNPNNIRELFGCDPSCVMKNYTILGAAIGIGTYAIFGLAAAMCQCNLMQFGRDYGMFAFLGAVLAGTLVGGFIGMMVGAGEAEKDTHLYLQRVRLGGKVISIRFPQEATDRVQQILARLDVQDVKLLQPTGA